MHVVVVRVKVFEVFVYRFQSYQQEFTYLLKHWQSQFSELIYLKGQFIAVKMFEATMHQCAVLKKIIEALQELVSEVNFDVTESGLSLQALDSSHVSLVCLKLKEDGFESYRCDRPMSMGLNVSNLQKLLKVASNEDKLTMRAQDNAEVIEFVFEGPGQDRMLDFAMKLMDLNTEQLSVPDQEYFCQVGMSSKFFTKLCRDFGAIGDTMMISIHKGGVRFQTSGDIGCANMNLIHGGAPDAANGVEIVKMQEPVTATFGLKFLNTFTKAEPLTEKVCISMSPDIPVEIRYDIGDMGCIKYFLAPKMDDIKEEDEMMD
eukprot:TRINITY_DN4163_c0_g2_i1.p1 TRINITY_DN4163_c0_g2~~TRINITY_DN4163_c0_g2_i1.p1  ORF type:complete len:317 (+),score=32.00 TRINITY_DN4163_c0_g2_i1:1-951(+)